MDYQFDVIWIGTGQATFTVVPKLAAAGKRVAIIEGGKFGGTCVNHGCTPTKTLVASAKAIQLAKRGNEFGFSTRGLEIDFAEVMRTQQVNRMDSSSGIEKGLEKLGQVFRGYAAFEDDHTIRVNDDRLTAETIVVHAGTRPVQPGVNGVETVPWLNNESLLDLTELPQQLIVVGGSYIALEFAQIFRRLGSEVTVLQRGSRLVSREDSDISELVRGVLTDEGIQVVCNCQLEKVTPENGVTVNYTQSGNANSISGSHILFATGRIPNSDRLNAQAAGLELSNRGYINVNEVMETSVPNIYAVGDINGRGSFTHTSVNDGEIFWDHFSRKLGINAERPEFDRTADQRSMIYSMFIDPPLARVGMNETQARASGRKVLMAVSPMSRIARAREKRETKGLVKIIVDAQSEEILGATVFGTGGDEVIGALAVFMQSKQSWKHFRRVVFPHPTVSELMPWIMDNLEPID